METVTPQSFFEPSIPWTRKLAKKIDEKTSPPHLRREISLRLWRILGALAREKELEKTVRCPIFTFADKKFEKYTQKKLEETLPQKSKSLIRSLGEELAEWLKKSNGCASFPKGHPIEMLRIEKHGIDMVLRSPVITLEFKNPAAKDR